MANSDIVIGWVNGTRAFITDRYASGRSLPSLDTDIGGTNDISDVTGKIVTEDNSQWTVLEFERALDTKDSKDMPISTTETMNVRRFSQEELICTCKLFLNLGYLGL